MTVEEKLLESLCQSLQCRMRLAYVLLPSGKRGFHIGVLDAWDTTQYFFESDYSEHMTEYVLRRQVMRKAINVLTRAVEKRAAAQALLTPEPTPSQPSHQVWPLGDSLRCLPLTQLRLQQQQEQQEQEAAAVSATDIEKWRRKPPPQAVQ